MTAQPSPEFRRHHDVEAPRVDATAFRQGWRVSTRLDQLRDAGAIDAVAWTAGIAFRADWERVYGRSRGGRLAGLPGGGGSTDVEHNRQIDRLAAFDRLRGVEARLGRVWTRVLEHCVVHDASWAGIGRLFGVDPHTARRWVASALQCLAAGARTRQDSVQAARRVDGPAHPSVRL